jgi:hypothetical protein
MSDNWLNRSFGEQLSRPAWHSILAAMTASPSLANSKMNLPQNTDVQNKTSENLGIWVKDC